MKDTNLMNNQKGGSFIGMLIVIAAIVFLGMIGLKVAPAYLEFMNVRNAVKKIAGNESFNTMSKKEIADAFDRSASVDNITVVKGSDLILEKTDSGHIVSTEYQVVVPMVANASVLLNFKATTAK